MERRPLFCATGWRSKNSRLSLDNLYRIKRFYLSFFGKVRRCFVSFDIHEAHITVSPEFHKVDNISNIAWQVKRSLPQEEQQLTGFSCEQESFVIPGFFFAVESDAIDFRRLIVEFMEYH